MRLMTILGLVMMMAACRHESGEKLLTHVHPLTGTAPSLREGGAPGQYAGTGQTIPAVTAPFGMTQWTLQTRSKEDPCVAPFYFLDGMAEGFRMSHWMSGGCLSDYGSFTLSPVSGQFTLQPSSRKAAYFFDNDCHSPGYSAVHMPAFELITEITATRRCGFFRVSWLNPNDAMIVIDVNNDHGEGFLEIIPGRNEIVASNPVRGIFGREGEPAGFSGHVVISFDSEFESYGTYAGSDYHRGETTVAGEEAMGGFVTLKLNPDLMMTRIRVGTSFTSIEQARRNMEAEIPGWDFDATREALEATWEELLGRIEVEGGTPQERNIFYTALYHSCLHPRLFSDADGSYPGFDGDSLVRRAEGFDYYTDFAAWDTHRAQMPLLSLIAPREYRDMVASLIAMAQPEGWLPSSPLRNQHHTASPGDYASIIIGDALMKGVGIDREKAWEFLRKNCFETTATTGEYARGMGRRSPGSYLQLGYIPLEDAVPYAFAPEGQVSRSLEYAFGDWVTAQVAGLLDKKEDEEALLLRALNYSLLYDPDRGWFSGKYADGTFTGEFSENGVMPWLSEATPQQASWAVPHDIPGLIALMGGEESFNQKLETFLTGGNFHLGHSPVYHVPYLFNYSGKWPKTQEVVTSLMRRNFSDDPAGLAGNDDAGQLSAWYVFSAMGFYPVCPGSNEYQLGAPLFPRVRLHAGMEGKGTPLTIEARRSQPKKPFTRVSFNGREIPPVLNHDQIQKGGKLRFIQK